MNQLSLEDRLRDLAGDVAAPATDDVRHRVGRRTGVLRRRRQMRRAGAAGALAVLTIVGFALLRHDPHDVELVPAQPDPVHVLEGLTLDLDGWHPTLGEETSYSLQVFQVPGQKNGPSVSLTHRQSSDPVVPDTGEEIDIGGSVGEISTDSSSNVWLTWNPANGDSTATIEASGLAEAQVAQLARGLQLKDQQIQNPPLPGTTFGFVASGLPGGLEEVAARREGGPPATVRRLVFERDDSTGFVDIVVDHVGNQFFAIGDAEIEPLTAMDHRATLQLPGIDGVWIVRWAPDDWTAVTVQISGEGIERADVQQVVDHLRALSEDEWANIRAGLSDPGAVGDAPVGG